MSVFRKPTHTYTQSWQNPWLRGPHWFNWTLTIAGVQSTNKLASCVKNLPSPLHIHTHYHDKTLGYEDYPGLTGPDPIKWCHGTYFSHQVSCNNPEILIDTVTGYFNSCVDNIIRKKVRIYPNNKAYLCCRVKNSKMLIFRKRSSSVGFCPIYFTTFHWFNIILANKQT